MCLRVTASPVRRENDASDLKKPEVLPPPLHFRPDKIHSNLIIMTRTFEDWEQQQAEQKAAEEAEAAAAEAAEAARLAAEQKAARGQLSSFSQRNNSTTSRHVRLPGDPDYPNSSTSTGGAGGGSSSRVSAFSRVSGKRSENEPQRMCCTLSCHYHDTSLEESGVGMACL